MARGELRARPWRGCSVVESRRGRGCWLPLERKGGAVSRWGAGAVFWSKTAMSGKEEGFPYNLQDPIDFCSGQDHGRQGGRLHGQGRCSRCSYNQSRCGCIGGHSSTPEVTHWLHWTRLLLLPWTVATCKIVKVKLRISIAAYTVQTEAEAQFWWTNPPVKITVLA
jgi:hypothetical protein